MIAKLRWAFRAVIFFIVVVLLTRAAAEYAPKLMSLPLVGALVRGWDPMFQRWVEALGLPWSRDLRGIGFPAVAVVMVVIREMIDDMLVRLERRLERPPPRAAMPRKPAAAGAPAAPPDDPLAGATVVTPPSSRTTPPSMASQPQASRTGPGAVQSSTGTAFQPAYKPNAGPPATIGRYEVISELGHGAMGTVYKARDPKIGRTVAIKTISAVGMGQEMEQYRERFLLEAKSAGRLSHPGVVAVYDVADDEYGRPCLVLEFVEGMTLDKLTSEGRLPLPRALDYMSQVARALDYAHGHGIVHRDVKPANVMITSAGVAKLSDFGIAKIEGTTLTVAGQVLGTPAFMSPEQCRGDAIDYRSDIFSFGAMLYLLATHVKPFPGETFTACAYQVVHNEHMPVTQVDPGLPPELEQIISRCLAKPAAGRYASAGRVADEIDAVRAKLVVAKAAPTGNGSSLPAS